MPFFHIISADPVFEKYDDLRTVNFECLPVFNSITKFEPINPELTGNKNSHKFIYNLLNKAAVYRAMLPIIVCLYTSLFIIKYIRFIPDDLRAFIKASRVR